MEWPDGSHQLLINNLFWKKFSLLNMVLHFFLFLFFYCSHLTQNKLLLGRYLLWRRACAGIMGIQQQPLSTATATVHCPLMFSKCSVSLCLCFIASPKSCQETDKVESDMCLSFSAAASSNNNAPFVRKMEAEIRNWKKLLLKKMRRPDGHIEYTYV